MVKIDDRAIGMYEDDLFSLQMIGDFFQCTRQGVKKYLNKRGIDTSKRKWDVICENCGNKFKKHRCQIRANIKNYCSPKCYYDSIHNPEYNENRQGQRIARKVVDEILKSEGMFLLPENIVHHEDGDTTHNDPENLIVFRNQSDHMRYHRGNKDDVKPIWDGTKKIVKKEPEKTIDFDGTTGLSMPVIENKPKYTEKYKKQNPGERCDFCLKTLQFCDC